MNEKGRSVRAPDFVLSWQAGPIFLDFYVCHRSEYLYLMQRRKKLTLKIFLVQTRTICIAPAHVIM